MKFLEDEEKVFHFQKSSEELRKEKIQKILATDQNMTEIMEMSQLIEGKKDESLESIKFKREFKRY